MDCRCTVVYLSPPEIWLAPPRVHERAVQVKDNLTHEGFTSNEDITPSIKGVIYMISCDRFEKLCGKGLPSGARTRRTM